MNRTSISTVAFVLLAAVFITVPFWTGPYTLSLATQLLTWILLAVAWDFLSGYTGQVSFGHGGFFAIGAYITGVLGKEWGFPSWVTLPLALAGTALCGMAVGIPALRVRGHYLALVTLAFAELVRLVATNWTSLTGGVFGLADFGGFARPSPAPATVFAIVLAVVAASIATMQVIIRYTRAGEIFLAIREDTVLAEAQGIDTTLYKVFAFTVSAGFTGLAGGLYAYVVGLVGPDLSAPSLSAMIIGMAVVGGVGTLWGPAIGACLLYVTSESLRFVGIIANVMLFGAVMMAFVILLPRGLAGLIDRPRRRTVRADADNARQLPATPSSSAE